MSSLAFKLEDYAVENLSYAHLRGTYLFLYESYQDMIKKKAHMESHVSEV
jgi:hypothetical protein